MGFITDALAPKNKFQAQKAELEKSNYGGTIDQAQAGALNQGNFNTGFGAQQGVLQAQQGLQGQLGDVAAGKGPNPAQEMLKQQTSQNINTAAGQAASARGINPALAARMAVDSAGGANQQAAGQGATLQAQQSLGALGQQVGNAAAMGQTAQGMTAAGLGQQGLQNQVLGTAGGLQGQQNNAEIANTMGANQINAGVASQNAANSAAMLGGMMNAAGGAMALSDERVKSNVVRTPGKQVLPGVPQATFEYNGFPGRYEGVIAQDVNRVRPDLVGRGPDGYLRVDPSLAPHKAQKMAAGGTVAPQGAAPGSPIHSYLDSLAQVASPPPQGPPPVQQFAGGGMAQPNAFQMPTAAPAGGLQAPGPVESPFGSTTMPTAPQLGSPALGIPGQAPMAGMDIPKLQTPAWASEGPSQEESGGAAAKQPFTGFSGLQEGGLGAFDRFARMNLPGGMAEGGTVVRDPGQAGPPAADRGEYYLNTSAENYAKDRKLYGGMNDSPWARQSFPGYEPRRDVDPALEARFRESQKHAAGGPIPFLGGGNVPGQARVAGNSEQNDIVPALLSPGEMVIPRDIAQSPDAPAQAAAFIAHLMKRSGKGESGYGKVLRARGHGKGHGKKMAEGGKVEGGAGSSEAVPSFSTAVEGWWGARGTPEAEVHGRAAAEALNALLPSMLSGRKPLLKKRSDLKAVDAATKD